METTIIHLGFKKLPKKDQEYFKKLIRDGKFEQPKKVIRG